MRSPSTALAAAATFAALSPAGVPAHANGTHLPDVVDVMLTPGDETSCACSTAEPAAPPAAMFALFGLAALAFRRQRR